MNDNKEEGYGLSEASITWVDTHLKEIRIKIVKRANELYEENKSHITKELAITEAAKEFAPGTKFPQEVEQSWWRSIITQLSAVTFISALLAIVFGIIAYKVSTTAGSDLKDAAGYIDLVKIFAGAIVGSTGATVAASVSRKVRKT